MELKAGDDSTSTFVIIFLTTLNIQVNFINPLKNIIKKILPLIDVDEITL